MLGKLPEAVRQQLIDSVRLVTLSSLPFSSLPFSFVPIHLFVDDPHALMTLGGIPEASWQSR